MRRFSIAKLMCVIFIIGLGIAALRNASDEWAGGALLTTIGLLGLALIGIAYRRERKRAWWFGFSLFGWGYLTITMGPWFVQEISPKLPMAQFLTYLHGKLQPSSVPISSAGGLRLSGGSPSAFWVQAAGANPGGTTSVSTLPYPVSVATGSISSTSTTSGTSSTQ